MYVCIKCSKYANHFPCYLNEVSIRKMIESQKQTRSLLETTTFHTHLHSLHCISLIQIKLSTAAGSCSVAATTYVRSLRIAFVAFCRLATTFSTLILSNGFKVIYNRCRRRRRSCCSCWRGRTVRGVLLFFLFFFLVVLKNQLSFNSFLYLYTLFLSCLLFAVCCLLFEYDHH